MESFHWSQDFVTGLPEVDRQHRHLVDVINRFGDLLVHNELLSDDVEAVFKELAYYADYHFKEEENLMLEMDVDDRHQKEHCDEHSHFLKELTSMKTGLSSESHYAAESLFRFLVHWVAYHILKADQDMARQIEEIKSGKTPDDAYGVNDTVNRNRSTEPLLIALKGLFEEVSRRNKELVKLNESLELKVAERTRELYEANRHLEEISLTDVLTELPNRRYAMKQLRALWDRSSETGSAVACMMVDADGFKQINDNYGHDAGDVVLKVLSKELCHAVRNDDIVCRLGGDEFFILCPDTPQNGAMHIAGIVRKEIDRLRVPAGQGEWKGSISIGVAARTPEMKTPDDLIKAADEGVYAAKNAGKNCVRSIYELPVEQ
ncbi:MAG: diguanylate cyclase [Desulfamplus sp.]|nr:diguanylate cyclase [Desulfamplus sp.]